MHMADALLSPAVGGTMWAASAAAVALSSARVRRDADQRLTPLMGVLGAFLFAAQMINFTIPGTGSSGHLAGGILLALLLGPHAAFLTIASVLVVQALFFADGGLLALGCNLFNMGVIPCFAVFPVFCIPLAGDGTNRFLLNAAVMASAVIALQLGAFAVVAETTLSHTAAIPFSTFLLLMQPIHLAIGVVEGAATIAILSFILKTRPDLVKMGTTDATAPGNVRRASFTIFAVAILTAGFVSSYASAAPDGLEWALARITGKADLAAPGGATHRLVTSVQKRSALFPDYRLPEGSAPDKTAPKEVNATPPTITGTGLAGIAGTLMTLVLAFCCTVFLRKKSKE